MWKNTKPPTTSSQKKTKKNAKDQSKQQQQQHHRTTKTAAPHNNNITSDSVYEFYKEQLLPAIWASMPLLANRIYQDTVRAMGQFGQQTWKFLKPTWVDESSSSISHLSETVMRSLLNATTTTDTTNSSSHPIAEYMLRHLDTNQDGHISAKELLQFQDFHLPQLLREAAPAKEQLLTTQAWLKSWLSLSLNKMMDWKVLGLYLMKSCGGLLLVIAIATIIPGRLHGLSGRLLRWPILFITYWMIIIELVVYTLVRMFIRLAEVIFANPKHRTLRQACKQAKSYQEWYNYSQQLDDSQGRSAWQQTIDDDSSYMYNWNFIHELMQDMRSARHTQDPLQALAVLQQCTRKNVGGMMSEDMFSYLNTGEPKDIAEEFIEEVVTTLRWVTEDAIATPPPKMVDVVQNNKDIHGNTTTTTTHSPPMSDCGDIDDNSLLGTPTMATTTTTSPHTSLKNKHDEEEKYEFDLKQKVIEETTKLLMSWATLSFLGNDDDDDDDSNRNEKEKEESSSPHSPLQPQNITRENHAETATSTNEPPFALSSSFDDEPEQSQHHQDTTSNGTAAASAPAPFSTGEQQQQQQHHSQQLPTMHHRERVKIFLKRARAAYGRTAMCLSGGAMMGNYHWGHLKALLEENALPHIISGTSAGSVVGAFVCCRTDEEIRNDMRPEILVDKLTCFSKSWPDRLRNVYEKMHMFDNEDWLDVIQWFTCGDMTFEEAYRKTGRVLCITLSATTKKAPPILANYISAPNVTIASAIVASAAVPGFIKPVVLRYKDSDGMVREAAKNKGETYWDGSIDQDIPTSGLAEMLNCQFFVAAQCNPHIVPFFYNSKGDVGRPSRWSSGVRDDSWRGGFLLSAMELYLKNDMRAKFHFLNDLNAAVSFTSTMMTQQTYGGSTTIVPQVVFQDYFQLFTNPSLRLLQRCFQAGSVAAYQHIAMIKLHYRTAHALEECLAMLERADVDNEDHLKPRRRRSQLAISAALASSNNSNGSSNKNNNSQNNHKDNNSNGIMTWRKQQQQQQVNAANLRGKQAGGLTVSTITPKAELVVGKTSTAVEARTFSESSVGSATMDGADDEYEQGGFDGMELSYSGHGLLTTSSVS